MKTMESHTEIIEDFKAWKWKILGMTTLGGLVAGIVAFVIPYILGKH